MAILKLHIYSIHYLYSVASSINLVKKQLIHNLATCWKSVCADVIVSGTLSSLLSPDNCPTLADKPKLFFVQACQSINKARPAPLLTSQRIVDPPIQKQDGPSPTTSTSDLFFAYSYAISVDMPPASTLYILLA